MKKNQNSKSDFFAKPYVLLIAFIIVVFSQVISFDYTGFDDDFLIVNNMSQLKNWDNLTEIFTGNSFLTDAVYGFYRPLQTLSFMIDAQFTNDNLFVFHLSNLIFHIITTLLLFKFLKKLEFPNVIATITSLFYAINPLLTSTVAWLPARGDLLLTLFSLASFINLIEYINTRKILNLSLHIIFFAFALFSKETAAIFPVIFILYLIVFKKIKDIKSIIIPVILWFIIGLFWFYLRSLSVKELPDNQIFGLVPFLENIPAFAEYLAKFFIPVKLDLLPVYTWANTLIGAGLILLLIISIIKFKDIRKYLIFGLIWYLVIIFPGTLYSRNYPFTTQFYQYLDHRAYLSIIGIIIFVSYILKQLLPEKLKRNFTMYSMIVIIIFSLISFFKVQYYKTPETFLSKAIEQNPQSSVANFLLANYYKDNLKYGPAINFYTTAIDINPDYAEALNNRGILYALQNQLELAVKDLSKAIKLNPKIPDGYYNRAMIWEAMGKVDEAIDDYYKALETRPNDRVIMLSLSNLFLQKKDFEQCKAILEKLIEISPDYYAAYYNMANMYLDMGNYEKAIEYYTKTLSLQKNYSNAYINRANAYWNLKQYDSACKDWLTASELGDKNAGIMYEKYCLKIK